MTKVYSFSDGEKYDEEKLTGPMTHDKIQRIIQTMAIMCTAVKKLRETIVQVEDNVGTTGYLSSGQDDFETLKKLAYKTNRVGSMTLYHIKTDNV